MIIKTGGIPVELWDIYDKNRNITGKTHERGTPLSDGIVVLSLGYYKSFFENIQR